jgi:hypothetical protein
MKILLLYVPRSGSTSILRYFKSIKPEYTVVNQPWSELVAELTKSNMITYDTLIKNENIFIKSDIGSFVKESLNLKSVKSDFDKIIILDRKDTEKQIESLIHASHNNSFLESNKYWLTDTSNYIDEKNVADISERSINEIKKFIPELTNKLNSKFYFYEDLFFGDFLEFFNYLEIDYNEELFKKYLSKENKYRLNSNELKEKKSLI